MCCDSVLTGLQQDDVTRNRTTRNKQDLAVRRPFERAKIAVGEVGDLLDGAARNRLPPNVASAAARESEVHSVAVRRPLRDTLSHDCPEWKVETKNRCAAFHRHSEQLITRLRRIGVPLAVQHEFVIWR